jgi:hypothetical protein
VQHSDHYNIYLTTRHLITVAVKHSDHTKFI